ncbi:MAG: universal stress protein [Woeseiaceae bacterium]|nr:universal stress protein [Woeseiaceae bacterium]
MSNTVLAVIEFERFPKEVAVRAARIAKQYGCDLEIVLSDPTIGFLRKTFMISVDSQQISETVQQAQKEELDRIVETVAEFGVEVRTSVVQDRPASDAIVARALEIEPRFVVKGTDYHSAAERAVFTFNDWQLIRKLDFPLWLVKAHEWKEKPVLVAAVDPIHPDDEDGRLAQAITSMAESVAGKVNGKLLLMCTYELLEEVNTWAKLEFKPLKVPMEELEKKMHDDHLRELESLAAGRGIDPQAIHLLPGRTKDILPAFAREKNADLVIMGAVARSGLKRRLIGSTAEHVLDHVPCDILIVHRG